jgi:hypothetical protein
VNKYAKITFGMILILGFLLFAFQYKQRTVIKERNEDLDFLIHTLQNEHPALYSHISEDTWNKQIALIRKHISEFDDDEFVLNLVQLVAMIGDSHTKLNFKSENDKIYPLKVKWFEKGLRVLEADEKYKEILGLKLIAINNISIEEIIHKLKILFPHQNMQWFKYQLSDVIIHEKVLQFIGINKVNYWTFEDDNGQKIQVKIVPIQYKKASKINMVKLDIKVPEHLQKPENSYDQYWYKMIPDKQIIYWQYNICVDRSDTGDENTPDFMEFVHHLIDDLNNEEVKTLIIDLRKNRGGNSLWMKRFIDVLTYNSTFLNNGKIYVLIGKETFSSGLMAAVDLKDKLNAKLVGEETGGDLNAPGEIKLANLPNSNITLYYSTKLFHLKPNETGGLKPDIEVQQHFNLFVNGIDEPFETILKLK